MEVLDLDTIPATTTASASLDVLSELLENTRLQGWIAEESPITARLSRPRFCDRPNEPEQRKASRGPGAAIERPGRPMDGPKCPWQGCLFGVLFVCVAHSVVTHSCRSAQDRRTV